MPSVNLNYTPLTNPFIWFANVGAFNDFIGSITVTIDSAALPPATLSAIGAVKMVPLQVYSDPILNQTFLTINLDDGSSAQVPSHDFAVDMAEKLDDLSLKYEELILSLIDAGIMSPS